MCTVPPVKGFCSRDSTAHSRRFYTFNPTKSQKLTEKSKTPISDSLVLLSLVKHFCANICFILKQIKIFQLTKLSRIENVNCELLRGLAKEKLPGILERENVQAHGRGNNCTGTRSSWQGSRHYIERAKVRTKSLCSSELMY